MTRVIGKLHWPFGQKRTLRRQSTTLGRRRTIRELVAFIADEAAQFARPAYGRRLDIRSLIVTYNEQAAVSDDYRLDHGAAVHFKFDGRRKALACDRWMSLHSNLAAVGKHLQAMRGMARWGVGSIEQAFMGYAALPPARPTGAHDADLNDVHEWEDDWDQPSVTPTVDWREMLDLGPRATYDEARDAFRSKMRQGHPDSGGSHDEATRLNDAWFAAQNFFRRHCATRPS